MIMKEITKKKKP